MLRYVLRSGPCGLNVKTPGPDIKTFNTRERSAGLVQAAVG
jgi:hypothetical protein